MNTELISLGAGVLIGLIYALLKVRSPAPPAVALVGLLGMLVGEHLVSTLTPHDTPHAAISQPRAVSQSLREPEAPDQHNIEAG